MHDASVSRNDIFSTTDGKVRRPPIKLGYFVLIHSITLNISVGKRRERNGVTHI